MGPAGLWEPSACSAGVPCLLSPLLWGLEVERLNSSLLPTIQQQRVEGGLSLSLPAQRCVLVRERVAGQVGMDSPRFSHQPALKNQSSVQSTRRGHDAAHASTVHAGGF